MANFGNQSGPYNYGQVASLMKDSVTAATGVSAVEGTDKLTFTADYIGLYRVTSVIRVRTAGVGAAQAVRSQLTHNNGTAISIADVSDGVAVTPLPLTGAAGTFLIQSGVYKCVAGTNVVVTLLGSGTFTTPAVMDVYVSIERI